MSEPRIPIVVGDDFDLDVLVLAEHYGDEETARRVLAGPGSPYHDDDDPRASVIARGEDPPAPVVDLKTVALDELAMIFGDGDDTDDDKPDDNER